ncbi:unnamed protein product [Amoebophrya sp. A120]|nr:unnamed protein product [Amoebophrya sp. A120]|eukprot:GSA120T00019778001.1
MMSDDVETTTAADSNSTHSMMNEREVIFTSNASTSSAGKNVSCATTAPAGRVRPPTAPPGVPAPQLRLPTEARTAAAPSVYVANNVDPDCLSAAGARDGSTSPARVEDGSMRPDHQQEQEEHDLDHVEQHRNHDEKSSSSSASIDEHPDPPDLQSSNSNNSHAHNVNMSVLSSHTEQVLDNSTHHCSNKHNLSVFSTTSTSSVGAHRLRSALSRLQEQVMMLEAEIGGSGSTAKDPSFVPIRSDVKLENSSSRLRSSTIGGFFPSRRQREQAKEQRRRRDTNILQRESSGSPVNSGNKAGTNTNTRSTRKQGANVAASASTNQRCRGLLHAKSSPGENNRAAGARLSKSCGSSSSSSFSNAKGSNNNNDGNRTEQRKELNLVYTGSKLFQQQNSEHHIIQTAVVYTDATGAQYVPADVVCDEGGRLRPVAGDGTTHPIDMENNDTPISSIEGQSSSGCSDRTGGSRNNDSSTPGGEVSSGSGRRPAGAFHHHRTTDEETDSRRSRSSTEQEEQLVSSGGPAIEDSARSRSSTIVGGLGTSGRGLGAVVPGAGGPPANIRAITSTSSASSTSKSSAVSSNSLCFFNKISTYECDSHHSGSASKATTVPSSANNSATTSPVEYGVVYSVDGSTLLPAGTTAVYHAGGDQPSLSLVSVTDSQVQAVSALHPLVQPPQGPPPTAPQEGRLQAQEAVVVVVPEPVPDCLFHNDVPKKETIAPCLSPEKEVPNEGEQYNVEELQLCDQEKERSLLVKAEDERPAPGLGHWSSPDAYQQFAQNVETCLVEQCENIGTDTSKRRRERNEEKKNSSILYVGDCVHVLSNNNSSISCLQPNILNHDQSGTSLLMEKHLYAADGCTPPISDTEQKNNNSSLFDLSAVENVGMNATSLSCNIELEPVLEFESEEILLEQCPESPEQLVMGSKQEDIITRDDEVLDHQVQLVSPHVEKRNSSKTSTSAAIEIVVDTELQENIVFENAPKGQEAEQVQLKTSFSFQPPSMVLNASTTSGAEVLATSPADFGSTTTGTGGRVDHEQVGAVELQLQEQVNNPRDCIEKARSLSPQPEEENSVLCAQLDEMVATRSSPSAKVEEVVADGLLNKSNGVGLEEELEQLQPAPTCLEDVHSFSPNCCSEADHEHPEYTRKPREVLLKTRKQTKEVLVKEGARVLPVDDVEKERVGTADEMVMKEVEDKELHLQDIQVSSKQTTCSAVSDDKKGHDEVDHDSYLLHDATKSSSSLITLVDAPDRLKEPEPEACVTPAAGASSFAFHVDSNQKDRRSTSLCENNYLVDAAASTAEVVSLATTQPVVCDAKEQARTWDGGKQPARQHDNYMQDELQDQQLQSDSLPHPRSSIRTFLQTSLQSHTNNSGLLNIKAASNRCTYGPEMFHIGDDVSSDDGDQFLEQKNNANALYFPGASSKNNHDTPGKIAQQNMDKAFEQATLLSQSFTSPSVVVNGLMDEELLVGAQQVDSNHEDSDGAAALQNISVIREKLFADLKFGFGGKEIKKMRDDDGYTTKSRDFAMQENNCREDDRYKHPSNNYADDLSGFIDEQEEIDFEDAGPYNTSGHRGGIGAQFDHAQHTDTRDHDWRVEQADGDGDHCFAESFTAAKKRRVDEEEHNKFEDIYLSPNEVVKNSCRAPWDSDRMRSTFWKGEEPGAGGLGGLLVFDEPVVLHFDQEPRHDTSVSHPVAPGKNKGKAKRKGKKHGTNDPAPQGRSCVPSRDKKQLHVRVVTPAEEDEIQFRRAGTAGAASSDLKLRVVTAKPVMKNVGASREDNHNFIDERDLENPQTKEDLIAVDENDEEQQKLLPSTIVQSDDDEEEDEASSIMILSRLQHHCETFAETVSSWFTRKPTELLSSRSASCSSSTATTQNVGSSAAPPGGSLSRRNDQMNNYGSSSDHSAAVQGASSKEQIIIAEDFRFAVIMLLFLTSVLYLSTVEHNFLQDFVHAVRKYVRVKFGPGLHIGAPEAGVGDVPHS